MLIVLFVCLWQIKVIKVPLRLVMNPKYAEFFQQNLNMYI